MCHYLAIRTCMINDRKKNVLFISRSYFDDSPIATRHASYINYLKKRSNLTILNITKKLQKENKTGIIRKIMNKCMRKLPLLPDSDILVLNRYKRKIKDLFKNNQYNIVLIGILPFSFLYLTKYIKNINSDIKIIVDMTDPISANMYFSIDNDNKSKSFKNRFMINYEKKYMKFVDVLTVLNEEIRQYYLKRFNNIRKIIVIEQGIEEDIIIANTSNSTAPEKLNLIYAGNFYKYYREPFELYKSIDKSKLNLMLIVYGSFKKCFIPPNKSMFYYGGRIPREKLKWMYTKAHIIVFIDNKDTIQVPGKILEILALNKPILFIYYNSNSPTIKIVKKYKGIHLTRNHCDEINHTINRIIQINRFNYDRNMSDYHWNNLFNKLNEYIN